MQIQAGGQAVRVATDVRCVDRTHRQRIRLRLASMLL